jgi:hypothetical protein
MRALDCAAIRRQKLASVRQQDSSRDVMNRGDENEISIYRCLLAFYEIALKH